MLKELCEKRGVMQIWDEKAVNWKERREQLVQILCEEEYGFMPEMHTDVSFEVVKEEKTFCAGKATLSEIKVTAMFGEKAFSFPIYATIPNKGGKYPFFVHINFRPEVPDRYLPVEEIIDRGFAVISFCYHDVTFDDRGTMPTRGVNEQDLYKMLFENREREANHCGKITLWAWAASRALDYAYTLDCLDHSRSAVIGHSRLGKTALVAGALDERFQYVISNDSGCSGAAITKGKVGENVEAITRVFPYWFCDNYQKYIDKEDTMAFDQHFLIAASAPRKVCVGSAWEDTWADPASEYLACCAASEVYEKLGMTGLTSPDRLPEEGEVFQEGNISYHVRKGSHYLGREDWNRYMDFVQNQAN